MTLASPSPRVAIYTIISYIYSMEFVELPQFSEAVDALLSKDEFRKFQNELIGSPEKGDLIQEFVPFLVETGYPSY